MQKRDLRSKDASSLPIKPVQNSLKEPVHSDDALNILKTTLRSSWSPNCGELCAVCPSLSHPNQQRARPLSCTYSVSLP